MNIISRAEWGARPAKPGVKTVAMAARTEFIVHYSDGPPDQSVSAIQAWCMDGRGFLDIDYNFLVRGTTAETYAGRGWLAVGSHTVGHNSSGLGICIIGRGEFSPAARQAVRDLYAEAVRAAGHPLRVYGHRDLAATDCPGDDIYTWVHSGAVQAPAPRLLRLTTPPMTGDDVRAVQVRVGATPDGIYGPKTTAAVRAWQQAHGLAVDGIVGPITRASLGLG